MVQNNDDIIDLTDMVPEDSSSEEEQEIIELTEIAPGDGTGADIDETFDFDDAVEIGPEEELTLDREVDAVKMAPVPAGENKSGNDLDEDALSGIGRKELDAALERVIEKKFSQTIETILFEVMEKVLQREIADIKTSLQKDLDDIGKS